MAQSFDFHQASGHLVRRAHRRAVALCMEKSAGFDGAPVQFAIPNELIDQPGADQLTLAKLVCGPARPGNAGALHPQFSALPLLSSP